MGLQRLQKDGPAQGPPPIGAGHGDQRQRYPLPVDVGERAAGQLPIEGRGVDAPGTKQPDGERREQQNDGNPLPLRAMSPIWAMNRVFSALRGGGGELAPYWASIPEKFNLSGECLVSCYGRREPWPPQR